MLAGVNDRYEQAVALARLLRSAERIFKVNLIPYNPTGRAYGGSSRDAIAAFRAVLEEHGVRATVRLTRGRDIDAACGQLAASAALEARGPRRPGPLLAARFAGAQQALAQLACSSGVGSHCGDVGQLVQRAQAEQLQERGRRAVEDGAELRAPGLLDRPRSSSVAVAESALTPRMRVISGREIGCR